MTVILQQVYHSRIIVELVAAMKKTQNRRLADYQLGAACNRRQIAWLGVRSVTAPLFLSSGFLIQLIIPYSYQCVMHTLQRTGRAMRLYLAVDSLHQSINPSIIHACTSSIHKIMHPGVK